MPSPERQYDSQLTIATEPSQDGEAIFVDAWPWSAEYTAGKMNYEEITKPGTTPALVWRRTYTWDGDDLVSRTGWVKQA